MRTAAKIMTPATMPRPRGRFRPCGLLPMSRASDTRERLRIAGWDGNRADMGNRETRGGGGGIRTHGALSGTRDFQSRPLGLYGTPPKLRQNDSTMASRRVCPLAILFFSRAEGAGFEPAVPYSGTPLFESGTINHSDTLPPRSIAQFPNCPQAVDDLSLWRQTLPLPG